MSAAPDSIVITGIGLASPLGLNVADTWQNVVAGRCGIAPAPAMDGPLPPGADAGQCPDLPADFAPGLPRADRYLRWAIEAAMRDSGVLDRLPCETTRATVMLGTTLHGMRAGGKYLRDADHAHLKHFLGGAVLNGAVGDLPLHGGRMTTCSACSSSLGAIALGVTLLEQGAADLVIAGGYDPISEYAWAGFNSLRLVSGPPLRPFTRGRVGMKVSESYAIVVLERAADAARRNAKIFAVVAGWGESADAHHLTQPHPKGDGAFRAMRDAVTRAGIQPQQIGLIAAHATGTPDNDAAEAAAIGQLVPTNTPPVVGFKSHLGHTLGGAGAAELILAGCALRDGTVPPTANITPAEIEFDHIRLATTAAPATIDFTLSTSLGFGGANTSVVLSRQPRAPRRNSSQTVVITGIGTLLPGVVGKEQLAEADLSKIACGAVAEETYESLLVARRVRRMSTYVKLTLAAVALACRDAGLNDPTAYADTTAGFLGTMHGSAEYCRMYYGQVVNEGATAANPLLFAEGVPNAAAAQLSLMLGLKQSCQTLLGTRTSGLDALRLAALRIRAGDWQRAIVSAGEEFDLTINDAYSHCGIRGTGRGGFDNTAGAVAFVIESAEAAAARGAAALATIGDGVQLSGRKSDVKNTVARLAAHFANAPFITAPAGTSWLAREEDAGLAQAGVNAISLPLPELFSATSLAALAISVTRKLEQRFVTLSTDFGGLATALQCEVA